MTLITNQYFIIWNHGIKYLQKIIYIIRNNPAIRIKKIVKTKNTHIKNFIKHIYKLDKSSYQHIEAKTKYLLTMKPYFFVIFVTDIDTIYKTKPNSNHIYSYHETFLKWHIRLLFNPRTKNQKVNINKQLIEDASIQHYWPNFITHNHVIHSSDTEEDTNLVVDFFHISKIAAFRPKGDKYLHIKKKIKDIHINELLVNTANQNQVNIKDTPHYKYLLGNYKKEYDEFIMQYIGSMYKDDHLSGAYDKLIEKFDYGCIINGIPSYIICKFHKKINKYIVIDGIHRLAILVKNGISKIKIYVIE